MVLERIEVVTNDELEKFGLNFSRCANRDVNPSSLLH